MAPPPGFWLKFDGTALAAAALGVSLPVDPGSHSIQYGAPGKRARSQSISVVEGEAERSLPLTELVAEPSAKPAAPTLAPSATPKNQNLQTNALHRRIAAGACIGGGVVALIFGAYAGFEAGSQWDQRNEHCRGGCDRNAAIYGENAHRFALLSNLSIATGLVSAGVGIYLLSTLKAHHGLELSARAQGTHGSTLILKGNFQ